MPFKSPEQRKAAFARWALVRGGWKLNHRKGAGTTVPGEFKQAQRASEDADAFTVLKRGVFDALESHAAGKRGKPLEFEQMKYKALISTYSDRIKDADDLMKLFHDAGYDRRVLIGALDFHSSANTRQLGAKGYGIPRHVAARLKKYVNRFWRVNGLP